MSSIFIISTLIAGVLHLLLIWIICLIVGLALTFSELLLASFIYTLIILSLAPPTSLVVAAPILGLLIWRFTEDNDIVEKLVPIPLTLLGTYFLVLPVTPIIIGYITP